MAKQKMVQGESQEMIAHDEAPPKAHHSKKHKAKVNMILDGGTELVQGQHVELSDEQLATLKASFGEGISHILE
jgi:hypothetical protein